MEGYNISIQYNNKTILGVTQDTLNIEAKIKESLTKDDQGNTKVGVTGHNVTFSVSALALIDGTNTTQLQRDEVIAMALNKGNAAVIPIKYLAAGCDTYGGNAVITSYSENSAASTDQDVDISLNLRITGDFTKITETPAPVGGGD